MLDDVLNASTHPPHPEGDVGLPGASLPWMMHVLVASTSSLMSPMEQSRGLLLYCMLSRCPLCSEHVTAAIPPSPFPMAPSLLSCKALIDAAAPSPGSTDKHLYPPPAVPTPQARRAAGKRLHPGANTAHAGGFWSSLVPKPSPINLPLPWLPPLLAGPYLGEDPSISEVPNRASGAQARLHFQASSPGSWVLLWLLSSYLMGLLAQGRRRGKKNTN